MSGIDNILRQFISVCNYFLSIPRFKNKLVKGFAFVEFSSAEEANDALKVCELILIIII